MATYHGGSGRVRQRDDLMEFKKKRWKDEERARSEEKELKRREGNVMWKEVEEDGEKVRGAIVGEVARLAGGAELKFVRIRDRIEETGR